MKKLMDMAFTRQQAINALKMTDNNIERAVDWIFAHSGELTMRPVEVVSESMERRSLNFSRYCVLK